MEKKILIVVDPQVDFVSGTLAVPDAVDAMDRLAAYIRDKGRARFRTPGASGHLTAWPTRSGLLYGSRSWML